MYLELWFARKTVRRAIGVALVVGPILVTINQWEAVTGNQPFNILKVMLTFMVPYCVSSYSTVASRLQQMKERGER